MRIVPIGYMLPLSIAGMALSVALSQFVMIGLIGLLLLPAFSYCFGLGCWRVRRQESLSVFGLAGGIVLLSSVAVVVTATFWGTSLSHLTMLASSRPSLAPPAGSAWILPVALWLCASLGVRLGFGLWTWWPSRQLALWTLLVGAVFPIAIVAFLLLTYLLPVGA